MKGLLHEDISAIEKCAVGASGIIEHVDAAIHDFAQHTVVGIYMGLQIIYGVVKQIPQEFSDCKAIAPELGLLLKWIQANSDI